MTLNKTEKTLKSFIIDDHISIEGAVEVTVELQNGQRRWCFFITPESLSKVGDYIPQTNVRIHLGVSHMIVVSQLDKTIIEKTLQLIDTEGGLERHTVLLS